MMKLLRKLLADHYSSHHKTATRTIVETRRYNNNNQSHKVCVVGSGPAGFYTTQYILKNHPKANVDIYERLPAPFGLVRYGVAPDHPDVKNVIHAFGQTAQSSRVTFFGNVAIGTDVTLADLRNAYDVVVLAYGAAQDKWLGIQGETLPNVVSARRFVGWYNGLPDDINLTVDFSVERAVIVGNGNVALDVARILLTPIDILAKTDICRHSLDQLSTSKIKEVILVGRRGPLQVAFTIKELREIVNMDNLKRTFHLEDFKGIEDILSGLSRPRKRLTELLLKAVRTSTKKDTDKTMEFKFFRNPVEIIGSNEKGIEKLVVELNSPKGELSEHQLVESTGLKEKVHCGLLIKSIGYKSVPLADELPFDYKSGVIKSDNGRVWGMQDVYCSGWVSTGSVGVIATTMNNSFAVGNAIVTDLKEKEPNPSKAGQSRIRQLLENKGVNPVDFRNWLEIDKEEVERADGKKPREKIIDVEEMLQILKRRSDAFK
ncbi:NADPH:adrenodoxin oxidoreductase, mitochondrial-like isoform X1 [Artemia franciscana]|uniref:NADPH:adrenodoxin oxidoreductase, mitochondrial-like isoform X1 n=1 Tax=Artemia franciscana TaxID=6661 RepID=UPI0032DBBAC0